MLDDEASTIFRRTSGSLPRFVDEGSTKTGALRRNSDLAKEGKGLPGPIAASYYPIMKMIDNIAKGGFTFVRLLQTIADRAEKNIKR